MGKVRRSGFIFIWLLADHAPPHVHVYKDGRLVCKWRLDLKVEMTGKATPQLRKTLKDLEDEGFFNKLKENFDED